MTAQPGAATLPDDLVTLLHAALNAEQIAQGSNKRVQHRMCRALLGAADQLGYSLRDIADEVGRSWHTLRDRAKGCEPISVSEFATLAGVSPESLEMWLTSCTHDLVGTDAHGEDIPARRLLHVFLEHGNDRVLLDEVAVA